MIAIKILFDLINYDGANYGFFGFFFAVVTAKEPFGEWKYYKIQGQSSLW